MSLDMTQQGFLDIRVIQELILDGVLVIDLEVRLEVVAAIVRLRINESLGSFIDMIELFILDIFHIGYNRF